MIDTSKQYTYNGKPVRIYADGSDTEYNMVHGALLSGITNEWQPFAVNDFLLVEVWEPVVGELVRCWNADDKMPSIKYYDKRTDFWDYQHVVTFKGELPEEFKGLK